MKSKYDQSLLIVTLLLFLIGLVMVYSSSWPASAAENNSPFFIFQRQLLFGLAGIVVMLFCMKFPYKIFKNYAIPIFVISLFLALLVHSPLGSTVNNARRWLEIGGMRFMPSDVLKFGAVCISSWYLSNNQKKIKTFAYGFFPMILIAGLAGGAVYTQPDLSTAIVIIAAVLLLFLAAGSNIKHFLVSGVFVVIFGLIAIFYSNSAYSRLSRVRAIFNPLAYRDDEAWQLVQSLFAVSSGSLFGVGIGKSSQKYFYLSQAHSDFIFAILCEELGFIGAVFVISLYIVLIYRGIKIAFRCEDLFGRYLAIGITLIVGLQAFLNIAVVIGLFPPTGITLPLISQGGTSLIIFLAFIGILQNIHSQTYMKETNR